jgi:hypothetical protein
MEAQLASETLRVFDLQTKKSIKILKPSGNYVYQTR